MVAKKRATYQDVLDAPEHMVAEILAGELFLTPRPARKRTENASSLGAFLKSTFDFGIGGPGGWRILFEPAPVPASAKAVAKKRASKPKRRTR